MENKRSSWGSNLGLPRRPSCPAPTILSGCWQNTSTMRATVSWQSFGWSATIYKMPSQVRIASVPIRMVWLSPRSGRSLWMAAKPNCPASSSMSSYWLTTVTAENRAPGTASSARRMSVLPSSSAASLLPPKRRPLPAAMTRQPRESVCSIGSPPCQFLQSSIPIFGHNCKKATKFSTIPKKYVIFELR